MKVQTGQCQVYGDFSNVDWQGSAGYHCHLLYTTIYYHYPSVTPVPPVSSLWGQLTLAVVVAQRMRSTDC